MCAAWLVGAVFSVAPLFKGCHAVTDSGLKSRLLDASKAAVSLRANRARLQIRGQSIRVDQCMQEYSISFEEEFPDLRFKWMIFISDDLTKIRVAPPE